MRPTRKSVPSAAKSSAGDSDPTDTQLALFSCPPSETPAPSASFDTNLCPPEKVRPTVSRRAGATINHKLARPLYATVRGRRSKNGLYDPSQRLYQCGGEFSSFVYWKRREITLPKEVWDAIAAGCGWLEFIDHEKNVCWRVAAETWKAHAQEYNAGIGVRLGLGLDYFTVLDAEGNIVRSPTL